MITKVHRDVSLWAVIPILVPVLLLAGWGLSLNADGAASAAANADRASGSAPFDTPTNTRVPTVEPELAILQYVVDHNPTWTCMGPSGAQGHRYISDCNPFGYFSHPTSGYVDNYGSSGSAQAAWQSRRDNAQSVYPIFGDMSYGGYPGYYAGNINFPYAHYENYFWGSVWVMGAVSSDDTSFRGSPPVASAIYQAALTLGYLGTAPPTATNTPTYTPTPAVCLFPAGGNGAGCDGQGTYGYGFNVQNDCAVALNGQVTILFEVSDAYSGPWTVWDERPAYAYTFQQGMNHLEEDIYEGAIPWEYILFRFELSVSYGGVTYHDATWPVQICGPRPGTPTSTMTSTATGTATATYTPTPVPTCAPGTNYTVSQSTGAAIVPGTAMVPGSDADEALVSIPLPFRYYLYGQRFDTLWADTNGNVQFQNHGTGNFNECLPVYGYTYVIMPHWDNLDMSSAGCGAGCGIYTSVTGVGPNRIFNIEYRASRAYASGEVHFEVRLYEGRNRFEIVYGNVAGGGSGATVGVQSLRGVGHTEFSCNTAGLSAGLQLIFQLPECSLDPHMLIGHVTWQGRPSQPDPLQRVPITLTLRAGTDEIAYAAQTTDAYGFFTVSVASILPAPIYDWRVKDPKYLANSGQVIITDAWYTQAEMDLMRAGDANNDNAVNIADFNILRPTFGKAVGNPGYDDRADFDGDNIVDIIDFTLLKWNFGSSGTHPLRR